VFSNSRLGCKGQNERVSEKEFLRLGLRRLNWKPETIKEFDI
jgi:hypothetical protein